MGASVGKTVTVGGRELTVVRSIGEGGLGEIFLVRSGSGSATKQAALKRMLAARDDRPTHALAQWELKLNERLPKHAHLVACEGAHVITHPNGDAEYLILLEWCQGGSLLDWTNAPVAVAAARNERDILRIMAQVAEAVGVLHAHEPPIRHADLKGENVLLLAPVSGSGADGVWKLCDMGSSSTETFLPRTAAERAHVQAIMDKTTTPSYRAPEQVDLYSGKPITHAADCWALGVILYTMLFRVQPFPDGALATLSGKYHVPDQHRWSHATMHLLARCLTSDPTKRITVPQLQMSIAELLNTQPKICKPWTSFKAPLGGAAAPAPQQAKTLSVTATSSTASPSPTTSAASTPSASRNTAPAPAPTVASLPSPSPSAPPRPIRLAPPTAMSNVASPTPPASSPSFAANFDDDDFQPAFPDPSSVSPLPPSSASPVSPAVSLASASSSSSSATKPNVQIRPPSSAAANVVSPKVVPKLAAPVGGQVRPPAAAATAASLAVTSPLPRTKLVAATSSAATVDSDSEEEDLERLVARLVKRCTRDDVLMFKTKHLAKLVAASWTHRADVATARSAQQAQHGDRAMTPADLARHMLAWEGLPTCFAQLGKRPLASKAPVAAKALLLVHRLLQQAAPPILGQVYVSRRLLEDIESFWSPAQFAATGARLGALGDVLAPYAKHLLHRLAFHQLHPHFEGSMALGHYMWSLSRVPTWPNGWSLSPKLARDDVHHLLQLMAEALRLGQSVLEVPPTVGDDPARPLREQLILPLLDDLASMFRSATFMLAQLCLIQGVRPLAQAPSNMPRGIVTQKMIAEAAAITPPPSATGGPAPPSIIQPVALGSAAAAALTPQQGDVEVALDSPPVSTEDEQVLRTIPTLLSAHRTILERLHALFSAAHACEAVRANGVQYALPLSVHAFMAVPREQFPPASSIPLTAGENDTLCLRFQQVNEQAGRRVHRSIGPNLAYLHALPAVVPQQQQPQQPQQQQVVAPLSSQLDAEQAEADEDVEETPEERAARKEERRRKKEAKREKKALAEKETSPSPPTVSVVLTPFQRAPSVSSSSAAGATTPASSQQSSNTLHPPAPAASSDPFSSPASPLYSPDVEGFAILSPDSGSASASSGDAGGDDDPFSGVHDASSNVGGDDADPFAAFMQSTAPTPQAAASTTLAPPPLPTALAAPHHHTPFSPDSMDEPEAVEESPSHQRHGSASVTSAAASTPFDSAHAAESEEEGDDEDDITGGSASILGSRGKVRTVADYLPADYVRSTPSESASAPRLSPFEDKQKEVNNHSASYSSSDDEDEQAPGEDAGQWTQQQDEHVVVSAVVAETPFSDDDPFSSLPSTSSSAIIAPAFAVSAVDETPFDTPAAFAVVASSISPFDEPAAAPPASASLAPPAVALSKSQSISPFDDDEAASASGNPFDEEDAAPRAAAAATSATLGVSPPVAASVPSVPSLEPEAMLPDEIDFSELEFEERIGVGAFAEVFSGQWRGSDVAIKRLTSAVSASPEGIEEFRREIQLLRTLRHPSLLMFMAACTRPSQLCVVTELLSTSLFDLLHNSDSSLPWRATLQIALDTAKGMNYLHLNKGGAILHRDLKSPNILLDSGRRARVADFGLARTKTKAGTPGQAGTFQWMAPEVIGGGEYHEAADVYSFGVIMHELASRQVPFAGLTPAQVSVAVMRGERPPVPPTCPTQYAALMQACWDQESENRPPFAFIIERLTAQLADAKKALSLPPKPIA